MKPLAALGLLAFASVAGCSCPSTALQRMEIQNKAMPFGESPLFKDGRAMRPPPPGTVPRERPDPALVKPGTKDSPLPVTRALLERGHGRFDIYCATCHGRLGDGNSVVADKMSLRPPPSLHRFRDQPPGFFVDVMTQGYGLMPSYASELSPQDRWAVAAYIKALQLSQHAMLAQAPPDEQQWLLQEKP